MTEGYHEKNPNITYQHWDLNSELSEHEASMMNFDLRYALCIQKFITDRTSQSVGAGIRDSIFNRCIDATAKTREVPLVHAPCNFIILSRTRSRFR